MITEKKRYRVGVKAGYGYGELECRSEGRWQTMVAHADTPCEVFKHADEKT